MNKQEIWKFPLALTTRQLVRMPIGAQILSAQAQHGALTMWALVSAEAEHETRAFVIHGTGFPANFDGQRFVATVLLGPGVWHIFEAPCD
jgi:hypothetical protein